MVDNIRLRPGSRLEAIYGKSAIAEQFFCNYEVNPEFEWAIVESGFFVAARGMQNEIRAIESPAHRFFIATLFQPQLSSQRGAPHPVIVQFLRAAAEWKANKLDDQVLE
jgi:CTP synthase (UTP-ammonia lyase)